MDSRSVFLKTFSIAGGTARRLRKACGERECRRKLAATLLTAVLALAAGRAEPRSALDGRPIMQAQGQASVTAPTEQNALDSYGKLALAFVPNAGQTDSRVRYFAQAGGASFYFTPSEAVFAFTKEKKGLALRLAFLGANPAPRLTGARPCGGRVNYLIGSDPTRWRTGLATYGEIVYHDLWPGIDLAFRGDNGELKYEFHLAPGADPRNVRLSYRGAERLSLGAGGDLLIHTGLGVLNDSRPVSYQEVAGTRVQVASRYSLSESSYGIMLGPYDAGRSLVIDPGLAYSTYLGGGQGDTAFGIAVDAMGNAYVTGDTGASNFPTTAGAFDITFNGGTNLGHGDVFVTKLNPQGSALEYSTYLGGSANEVGNGIAVDATGNAYVTGWTLSSNFPTTPGAFDTSYNGGVDAFVTKLDATGSFLIHSTYLGGSLSGILCSPSPCPDDGGAAIAVDAAGNMYVTGYTRSRDFPTTPGAFDTSYTAGSGSHVFVTKLDPTGSALVYSTYLGGGAGEGGTGIAVDAAGNTYVTGVTGSVGFPTTPGAFDTNINGQDAFVTKVNADGSGLIYSTFLGGTSSEQGAGIAIDTAGNAYVVGNTTSPNFPTTSGAFDTTYNNSDVFVTKLNTDGSAPVYSTYLGGSGGEEGGGIAVDEVGNAYVAGRTFSADFPTTLGAFDTTFNGSSGDTYLTKLNVSGSAALYSTFLGGVGGEVAHAIAVDINGHAYLTGQAQNTGFPTTPGAFQPTIGGGIGGDAFVAKFGNQPPSAAADATATDEDNAVTISVLANDADPDGDPLTLSDVTQGSNGSVVINPDKTVTYSPAANFNGTDSFTYTALDTWGDTDATTVTVTINPVNDPPVTSDGSVATGEDLSIQINMVATDIDNSDLAFTVVSGPANGTLGTISGASVSYTPNANFNGSDSFTFEANDGMADSNVATVSIIVAPVNDPPDAVDDLASTNEETPVTINVRSNDTDVEGDTLTVTAASQGTHGTVTITGDTTSVSYTPAQDFFGMDSFTYTVNDGNGGTDTATINVTITNVQDAPSANDDAATVSEDGGANTINVLANDIDVDGNTVTVGSVTQSAHGAVVNNGTSVSFTPAPNYFGPDSFTYTVSDGQGGFDTATVNVTVTNVNDAPAASDDSYSIIANTTLVMAAPGVLANDTDIDGDALSAVLVTNVSNGTLSLASNGSFTYTPNLNFSGADSFTYSAFDQAANSNVVTVRINIAFNLIVFSSTRDGNSEIYSMGIDGSGQTRLTDHPAEDLFPTWSPDRTKIAFSSNRDGSFEIFVMNKDGSSPARLTTNALVEGGFDWSPDGTRIAFSSNRDGNPEIYVMNADGTGLKRLTKSQGVDTKPSWSPDGTKIVFSSDRKRSFEIYVMNADGTGLAQLTKNGSADAGAAWSPDGTKIAFSSNRDGNAEIYVMNPDGSGQTRLTTNLASDDEPAWSSDGLKILFTSRRDGNAEIYVMNKDGSVQIRLTMNPSGDTSADG